MSDAGAAEIARHRLSTPGNPRIVDAHYPHHPGGNQPRLSPPRARSKAEADLLDIGDGSHQWLVDPQPVRKGLHDAVVMSWTLPRRACRLSGVEFGKVGQVDVALPGPQRRLQRSFVCLPHYRQYAPARMQRGDRPKPARHQQIPRTPLAQ